MVIESRSHIGVDCDGDDWLAVGYSEDASFGAEVFESFENLWTEHGTHAKRVVADVPIGLCGSLDASDPPGRVSDGELSRHCDDLARRIVGSRSSSVFPAPCRKAVEEASEGASYDQINESNEEDTGKGLTQQAASLAPAISEVDELLRDAGDATTILEGHPELCFRALSDSELAFSKKTAPGVEERLSILESTKEYQEGDWRGLTRELAETGHTVGFDDLLDALALTVTAIGSEDEVQNLPPNPPRDGEGLPMRMVYRRNEPFSVEMS